MIASMFVVWSVHEIAKLDCSQFQSQLLRTSLYTDIRTREEHVHWLQTQGGHFVGVDRQSAESCARHGRATNSRNPGDM